MGMRSPPASRRMVFAGLVVVLCSDRGRFLLADAAAGTSSKGRIIRRQSDRITVDGNRTSGSRARDSPGRRHVGIFGSCMIRSTRPSLDPIRPVTKKSVWQKVDDAVNLNPNQRPGHSSRTTLQVGTSTQTTRENPVIKRPRVMVGGADRIENYGPGSVRSGQCHVRAQQKSPKLIQRDLRYLKPGEPGVCAAAVLLKRESDLK